MTTRESSSTNWLEVLAAHEQSFLPPEFRSAVLYLRNARSAREGWPMYPGLPAVLHESALVVDALHQSKDEDGAVAVADFAAFCRRKFLPRLSNLTIDDISDLMSIAACETSPDEDYVDAIFASFASRFPALFDEHQMPLTSAQLGMLIVAARHLRSTDSESYVVLWRSALIQMQRPDDGGWPVLKGESGSLIATAWAVRALIGSTEPTARKSFDKGLHYLEESVRNFGWEDLGNGGDTFSQALVLRALAEGQSGDQGLVQAGIDVLCQRMNSDGGWGPRSNEATGVEYTAVALASVLVAGAAQFVPARIARLALLDSESSQLEIRDERDALKRGLETRARELCGEVMAERNRLRMEADEAKREMNRLAQALEEGALLQHRRRMLPSEAIDQSLAGSYRGALVRSRIGLVSQLIVLFVLVGATALGIVFIWPRLTNTLAFLLTAVFVVAVLGIVSFVTYYFLGTFRLRRELRRRDIERAEYEYVRGMGSSADRRLVAQFNEITENWPPSIQEEFIYRLIVEMADMPPDIAHRYVRDVLMQLRVPARDAAGLDLWLSRILLLPLDERRVVLIQLRRNLT